MAAASFSGSSSSSRPSVSYDVFISHCGKDCKRNFADLLREKLEASGVRCFFDDRDLRLGDNAAHAMLDAMRTARFGVVILSKGFFEREWCVKELQTFLGRANLLPIFLSFEAPAEEEASGILSGFDTFEWTEDGFLEVIRGANNYTGLRLEALDGYWGRCFEQVKQEVLHRLGRLEGGPTISEPGQLFVNMEQNLEAIKGLMGLRGSASEVNEAQIVGIVAVKGMGGVGKTTLAMQVFDDKEVRAFFEGRVCWVSVKQNPHDRVCALQEQILRKLADWEVKVDSPEEGRALIRERLGGAKVLICLDDVWADRHPPIVSEHLLGPGSCILQTTRDAKTIPREGRQLNLDVLQPEDAERLFLFHAFGGQDLPAECRALLEDSLRACAGLPLALRVVGCAVAKMLADENGLSQWRDFLEVAMLETPDGHDVHQVLRSSYETLPDQDYRDVFILVACMWPRWSGISADWRSVDSIILSRLGAILEGGQPKARVVLQELEHRSLVSLRRTKRTDLEGPDVAVHDLLVDVAVKVAREGRPPRFQKWEGLTSLSLEGEHISLQALPSSPPFHVPSSFFDKHNVKSLVVIENPEAPSSCAGFSDGISSMVQQTRPPDRHQCKLLCMQGCDGLRSLPSSVCNLKDLRLLSLTHCTNLTSLPMSLGELASLSGLELHNCPKLEALPDSLGQLSSLKRLSLIFCSGLKILPSSIGQLTSLLELDLSYCLKFEALPETMGHLTNLKKLRTDGCVALKSLPESLSSLTSLVIVDQFGTYQCGERPWIYQFEDRLDYKTFGSMMEVLISLLRASGDMSL